MPRRITTKDLAAARALLKDIDRRHGEYMDELLADFGRRLDAIVEKSSAQVAAILDEQLVVSEDGTVQSTTQNLRVLRGLGDLFQVRMKANGIDALLTRFVAQFPEQLPLLTKTLGAIAKGMKIPITASKLFTPDDTSALVIKQQQTLDGMRQVIADVATLAKRRALAKVNGLRPRELQRLIEKTFDVSRGQAQTIAATGMVVFYREATDRAFAIIERGRTVRYVYDGPDDVLTRPFCHDLKAAMRDGKSWTRAEINAMDNGQLPDVMKTGGGYNCRHQWRIALDQPTGELNQSPARPTERSGEAREQNRDRQKAKRRSLAIAKLYPTDAPADLRRENLLAQAKVYEDAGFKIPTVILRGLDELSASISPEQLATELEVQLAKATAAASVLDAHGARSAWLRQKALIARLKDQLALARAGRRNP